MQLLLLLLFAVLFGGYLFSIRVHPLRKCPVCRMAGSHYGILLGGIHRRCRRCNGTGQLDRWGARVFFGGTKNTGRYRKK
jgi:DnaJ-class molecular chaperone